MLTIKDDVNLKELEKFGFKKEYINFYNAMAYDTDYREFYTKKIFGSKNIIAIDTNTREIFGLFNNYYCGYGNRFNFIQNNRTIKKLVRLGLIKQEM